MSPATCAARALDDRVCHPRARRSAPGCSCAPGEDLITDDLLVAPDHGIQLPLPRERGQVAACSARARGTSPPGSGRHAVACRDGLERLVQAPGTKDLGTSDDYRNEKMPPVNVGLLDGQLAWRQHDGGQRTAPNWKILLSRGLTSSSSTRRAVQTPASPIRLRFRLTGRFPGPTKTAQTAHAQLLDKASRCCMTSISRGSITPPLGATDYPDLLANWPPETSFGWNAAAISDGEVTRLRTSLAAGKRGDRWRQSEDHRSAGRH